MNLYFSIYLSSIILSILWWIMMFKKYKNPSWFFFLIFTISCSVWCLLYFLFLWWNLWYDITLILSRLAFSVSLLWMYTFLLFIIFFDYKKKSIFTKKVFLILFLYLVFFLFSIFSENIIHSLYLWNDWVYRENYGLFYPIYIIWYLLFIPLVLVSILKQFKKQNYINKLRLKYILYWVLVFIWTGLVLQVILPLFWIWMFEREIIFFFIFFILSVVYSVNRYYFNDLWYWIWKIIVWALALFTSIFIERLLNWFVFIEVNNWYWGNTALTWISSSILNIIFFIILYKLFSKYFLWTTQKKELENNLLTLKQNISYTTSLEELNNSLKIEIKKIFKTDFCEIKIFKKEKQKNELQKYFENKINNNLFINDIVFLEEKKTKFKKEKIFKLISKKSFLIFPIFNNKTENIAIFSVWKKIFWDFYSTEEINALKNFILFLEIHLKYIKTYEQIRDLSINLDKKIDEKTIEYNNLINKQKEFISVISHEIRSPISSAIFQSDSILDDLDNSSFSKENFKVEINILNNILLKVSDLIQKLFSVQYYETQNVKLYKENICINSFIKDEIEIYKHLNKNITFKHSLDKEIKFIKIDKIQFWQVIENLINNSIKFINQEKWIIYIETKLLNNNCYITIEDNWNGFWWIKVNDLFEKYSIWNSNSKWLWLGLYLCKKIIGMHNWEINAWVSEKLWWAKFTIKIPLN